MIVNIFIVPEDNRPEALAAWEDFLTPAQRDEIEEAPESALIAMAIDMSAHTSVVTIIPEG